MGAPPACHHADQQAPAAAPTPHTPPTTPDPPSPCPYCTVPSSPDRHERVSRLAGSPVRKGTIFLPRCRAAHVVVHAHHTHHTTTALQQRPSSQASRLPPFTGLILLISLLVPPSCSLRSLPDLLLPSASSSHFLPAHTLASSRLDSTRPHQPSRKLASSYELARSLPTCVAPPSRRDDPARAPYRMSRQPVDVARVRCDSLRSPLQVCGQVDAVPKHDHDLA